VNPSAAVTGQTIPDQGDLVTVELATQLAGERDQARVVVGTGRALNMTLASDPSEAWASTAAMDIRFQLSGVWITGVCPLGPRFVAPAQSARCPMRLGRPATRCGVGLFFT
jgi:hypothetical protein